MTPLKKRKRYFGRMQFRILNRLMYKLGLNNPEDPYATPPPGFTNVDLRAYPVRRSYTFDLYGTREIEIRSFKETFEKVLSVRLYSESTLLLKTTIEVRGLSKEDIDTFEEEWHKLHEKYKKIMPKGW